MKYAPLEKKQTAIQYSVLNFVYCQWPWHDPSLASHCWHLILILIIETLVIAHACSDAEVI